MPIKMPQLSKDVVFALRAMSAGNANEAQQKAALAFILFDACGIRNPSFEPSDPHTTAFNEGRRFAGLVIAGAIDAVPAGARASLKNSRQEAKPQ